MNRNYVPIRIESSTTKQRIILRELVKITKEDHLLLFSTEDDIHYHFADFKNLKFKETSDGVIIEYRNGKQMLMPRYPAKQGKVIVWDNWDEFIGKLKAHCQTI